MSARARVRSPKSRGRVPPSSTDGVSATGRAGIRHIKNTAAANARRSEHSSVRRRAVDGQGRHLWSLRRQPASRDGGRTRQVRGTQNSAGDDAEGLSCVRCPSGRARAGSASRQWHPGAPCAGSAGRCAGARARRRSARRERAARRAPAALPGRPTTGRRRLRRRRGRPATARTPAMPRTGGVTVRSPAQCHTPFAVAGPHLMRAALLEAVQSGSRWISPQYPPHAHLLSALS